MSLRYILDTYISIWVGYKTDILIRSIFGFLRRTEYKKVRRVSPVISPSEPRAREADNAWVAPALRITKYITVEAHVGSSLLFE